jgi:glyceraldehyde 3-phosphate dehydrogenase
MPNIAINGLGRIGRAALKQLVDHDTLDLVAVNDIGDLDNLVYLLGHDSVYGRWRRDIAVKDHRVVIDGRDIAFRSERDPAALDWSDLGVDIVLECTGAFRTAGDMRKHLEAGASRVVLSAPAKSDDVVTVVPGVNDGEVLQSDTPLVSTASCTTNCVAPVVEILDRHFGVEMATLTTVHAYTSSQALVDAPAGRWRRGRAAAINLVPTTTGAARATAAVVPAVADRFDGVAVRAPVPVGSLSDIVGVVGTGTSASAVNDVFRDEAGSDRYGGILDISGTPMVSSDVVGDEHGSVVDLTMTQVTGETLVKVMAWYDNEWGYAAQMIRFAARWVAA